MPQVGGYNQQVIDTMNKLAQPGLTQQSDAARARAAAMGITLGSNANNDVERTIGNNWNDSALKSIVAGYTQGNTEYDQALRGRTEGYNENLGQSQNQTAQRTAAEKERTDSYQALLSGSTNLGATRDSLNPNSWAAKVPTSVAFAPTGIYGAAADTFSGQMAVENQATAQSNANRAANTGIANTLLNTAGQIGWGNIGNGISNLWNGAGNLFNSWNSSPYSNYTSYNTQGYTTGDNYDSGS